MLKSILRRLNLQFEDQTIEMLYISEVLDTQNALLLITHIALTSIYIFLVLTWILASKSNLVVWLLLSIILISLLTFFARKRWPLLYLWLLVANSTCFLVFWGEFFAKSTNCVNFQGNILVIGTCQLALMLSFKSILGRVGLQLISILIKAYYIFTAGVIYSELLVLCFWVIHEIQNRKNFKRNYDLNRELKKFEDLISKYLPINVMILSEDL